MDPYKILGISKNASPFDVERAYRQAAALHHPNLGGDPWLYQQIQEAYETITHPKFDDWNSPAAGSPSWSHDSMTAASGQSTAAEPVSAAAMIAAGCVVGSVVALAIGAFFDFNWLAAGLTGLVSGGIGAKFCHRGP